MDPITIDQACQKYPWLDPKRLRGAIYQNRVGYPIGDAHLGLVQDDMTLERYAIRMGNEMRSTANWRQNCNNYNRTSEGER